MSTQPVLRNDPLIFEYDAGEDVLHIFMDGSRDNSGFVTFVSLIEQPEVFLRVNQWNSGIQGISVKPASARLGTTTPTQDAMRQLADQLVLQYGRMEHEEISRHQYKASHKLDGYPGVTWSYEPFSESLYVDLEDDVSGSDNVGVEDYPHLHLRLAHDDERIVGMFMVLVGNYLGTEMPTRGQLCALARELIARYAPQA